MATMTVKDGAGDDVVIEKPPAPGRAAASASRPVVLATEDVAYLSAITAAVGEVQVTPTANTALDRLKTISTLLTTVDGHVDGVETGLADANSLLGQLATAVAGAGNLSVATIVVQGRASMTPLQVADSNSEYETVGASQTAQVLGATGATGDSISGLLVIPGTTSPGNVILLDNATSITVFAGGASSVSNLVPFFIPLGMKSVSGAWKVTTGTNVTVIGIGNFT